MHFSGCGCGILKNIDTSKMSKNNNIFRWLAIALLITLPVVLLILAGLRGFRSNLPIMVKTQAIQENTKWADYNYLALKDSTITNAISRFIDSHNDTTPMSVAQKQGLNDELFSLLQAYSDGTYESYRQFRMPTGIPFEWKSESEAGTIDKQLDNLHLSERAHHISMDKKFIAYLVASGGNGSVYSNLFSGICLDQSRTYIRKYQGTIPGSWKSPFFTNTFVFPNGLWGLKGHTARFPNTTIFSEKAFSFIAFKDDKIDDVLAQDGEVLVADCFLFIKRRDPYPILPLIARFYWDTKAERWLPDDMVLCDASLETIRSIPLF